MTKPIRKEIREECSCQGSTLDSGESVLRGVKVIGYESKNGRRYKPEAVAAALGLYEGAFVNSDHPQGSPNQSRRVVERFGKLENMRQQPEGGFGDLRYNPHHPLAKAVEWFAANMPEALGLSHNAVGQGQTDEDGVFVVEKIVSVRSVDLVADPATTKSLFEDCMDPITDPAATVDPAGEPGHEEHLANAIAAIVKDAEMDPAEKLKKIKALLKVLDDSSDKPAGDEPVEDDLEDDEEEEPEKKDGMEGVEPTIESLQEEINRLKGEKTAKAERKAKKAKARQLCIQAGLPEHLVTAVFIEQVANAPGPQAQKTLIDDRRLTLVKKPTSAGKGQARTLTEEEFKKTLTGQAS